MSGHLTGPHDATTAEAIVRGTATEFPVLALQGSIEAVEEMLLRMIWHLQLAGFTAGRQRNPSGLISKDKLTIQLTNGWHAYDVLSDSATGSMDVHFDEVGSPQYVASPGIADGADNPDPEPEPPPASPVIPYDENKSIEFGQACNDVYLQAHAAIDPGMVSVHSSRAAWDYYVGGLDWPTSKKKHLNEFRAVYGLPPI